MRELHDCRIAGPRAVYKYKKNCRKGLANARSTLFVQVGPLPKVQIRKEVFPLALQSLLKMTIVDWLFEPISLSAVNFIPLL